VRYVVDVSAVLSWLLEDERDDEAVAMGRAVAADGAVVPALWRWELQNALLVAERRKRIDRSTVREMLDDLRVFPISIDDFSPSAKFGAELELARRYGLSAYDAAYLELAQRRGLLLMTRDLGVTDAAVDLGLRWTLPRF
jgi:predicted nucleic acid-binding protein